MRDDEKRRQRDTKRAVKREGNRRRRRSLKRDLEWNPEEAPFSRYEFGRDSSAGLNGRDRDRTRKRRSTDEEE